MEDTQELCACYERLYQGMVTKDLALLQETLSEAFILTHMTGLRQSKAEFMRSIQDGRLQYFSAETERIQIIARTQDSAILLGQSRVQAAVFGGGRHTWNLQLKLQLRREQNRWRMVEAVASTYDSSPIKPQ